MAFVTTTLRDTVVNAPKAGGMVTVKATFASDTATNLILDGDGLDGFANGAKLDLLRAWWSFSTGNYDTDNSNDCIIEFKGSSNDVVALHLSGTGHYDGSAGLIESAATNTGATSGDMELSCLGTSGFVLIEFKKDENYA